MVKRGRGPLHIRLGVGAANNVEGDEVRARKGHGGEIDREVSLCGETQRLQLAETMGFDIAWQQLTVGVVDNDLFNR